MALEFRRDIWEQKAREMAGQRRALNQQRAEGAGPVWNQRGRFGKEVSWPDASEGEREVGAGSEWPPGQVQAGCG